MEHPLNNAIRVMIVKHNLSVETLTEKQLADAIRQAIRCGDFQRMVAPNGSQMVVYLPGRGEAEIRAKYEQLIYAVAQVTQGETRHETALRYIREREELPYGSAQAMSAEGIEKVRQKLIPEGAVVYPSVPVVPERKVVDTRGRA